MRSRNFIFSVAFLAISSLTAGQVVYAESGKAKSSPPKKGNPKGPTFLQQMARAKEPILLTTDSAISQRVKQLDGPSRWSVSLGARAGAVTDGNVTTGYYGGGVEVAYAINSNFGLFTGLSVYGASGQNVLLPLTSARLGGEGYIGMRGSIPLHFISDWFFYEPSLSLGVLAFSGFNANPASSVMPVSGRAATSSSTTTPDMKTRSTGFAFVTTIGLLPLKLNFGIADRCSDDTIESSETREAAAPVCQVNSKSKGQYFDVYFDPLSLGLIVGKSGLTGLIYAASLKFTISFGAVSSGDRASARAVPPAVTVPAPVTPAPGGGAPSGSTASAGAASTSELTKAVMDGVKAALMKVNHS